MLRVLDVAYMLVESCIYVGMQVAVIICHQKTNVQCLEHRHCERIS